MESACLISQASENVECTIVSGQVAHALVLDDSGPDRDLGNINFGTICEWSELRSDDDNCVIGYCLEAFYDQRGRDIAFNFHGKNVIRDGDKVLIFSKIVEHYHDSGAPFLPVYALKKIYTSDVFLLLPEA